MVGTAKNRVEQVEEQLNNARVDFQATQEAAHKAASSAQEAQNNAAEAAAHASLVHHDTNLSFQSRSEAQAKISKKSVTYRHDEEEDDINGSKEIVIAPNHNYGSDFKPSTRFSFAGY